MDPRRFDSLTRSLAGSRSRRALLKGAAGVALGGLFPGPRGEGATASPKPKPEKPKRCLPEGKKSKDPGRCCSRTTADGRCCGEEFGSCAVTGCCGVASTPICHDGFCFACLAEGTPSSDPDNCCGKAIENGLCCGDAGGSCAVSGCCGASAGKAFCVAGTCVGCLPEGYPSADQLDCCSLALGDGVCCGSPGGSCAENGCCAGIGYVCVLGTCTACLPEGTSSSDPARCCSKIISGGVCRAEECLPLGATAPDRSLCCSLLSLNDLCVECFPEGVTLQPPLGPLDCCSEAANDDQVCCGGAGAFCDESGCCTSGFTCCNGSCFPTCPPPMTQNPETCLCEVACRADSAACVQDSECCSGACCNGLCSDTQTSRSHCGACGNACPAGPTVCQGGVCGGMCGGTVFCPVGVGNVCAFGGGGDVGAPAPVVCCQACTEGYTYQCGDGVCCCNPTPSFNCNGFRSKCS